MIDTVTNTIDATIGVDYPYQLAMSTDGTRLYVARSATPTVINTGTNSVVDTINIGGQPYDLVVNPDGTRVYPTDVTTDPYTVKVINTPWPATATIPSVLAAHRNSAPPQRRGLRPRSMAWCR